MGKGFKNIKNVNFYAIFRKVQNSFVLSDAKIFKQVVLWGIFLLLPRLDARVMHHFEIRAKLR
jgi:hypothetical protein